MLQVPLGVGEIKIHKTELLPSRNSGSENGKDKHIRSVYESSVPRKVHFVQWQGTITVTPDA